MLVVISDLHLVDGTAGNHNVSGKAFAIWMHWDSLFSIPSFSRAGLII